MITLRIKTDEENNKELLVYKKENEIHIIASYKDTDILYEIPVEEAKILSNFINEQV